jgi:hypothetical protein
MAFLEHWPTFNGDLEKVWMFGRRSKKRAIHEGKDFILTLKFMACDLGEKSCHARDEGKVPKP